MTSPILQSIFKGSRKYAYIVWHIWHDQEHRIFALTISHKGVTSENTHLSAAALWRQSTRQFYYEFD